MARKPGQKKQKTMRIYLLAHLTAIALFTAPASAKDIKYHRSVTLSVGQSIVLKGVRSSNCGTEVPGWPGIAKKLPASKLGTYSDGGAGTVKSNHCFNTYGMHYVPARGVRFTAKTRGTEKLKIFQDPVSITVK